MFSEQEPASCEDACIADTREIRVKPGARGRGRPGKYDIGAYRLDDLAVYFSACGFDLEKAAKQVSSDKTHDDSDALSGLPLEDARKAAAELLMKLDKIETRNGKKRRADKHPADRHEDITRRCRAVLECVSILLMWLNVSFVTTCALIARNRDRGAKNRKDQALHRARLPDHGIARLREWEKTNAETLREKRREKSDARYFVAIDAEGQNFPGDAIIAPEQFGNVSYAPHYTYLWGASSDADGVQHWLVAPETQGANKKPLAIIEILDWLLELPAKFRAGKNDPKPIFVMFAAGYDFTQILRFLPRPVAWEIFKAETFPTKEKPSRSIGNAPVFWKGYAFSFRKGKYLKLWKLKDGNEPYKTDGSGKRRINVSAHIEINDTFAFFQ